MTDLEKLIVDWKRALKVREKAHNEFIAAENKYTSARLAETEAGKAVRRYTRGISLEEFGE